MKHYYLLLILLIMSSCSNNDRFLKTIFGHTRMNSFQKELAKATPEFREGWKDGCHVGIASGANSFYKLFLDNNRVDGFKKVNSKDYAAAYDAAFWTCYREEDGDSASSIYGSFFGGYK